MHDVTRAGYPQARPGEPQHWFVRFILYFLPLPRPDVESAFIKYIDEGDERKAPDSSGQDLAKLFPDDCQSDHLEHWKNAASKFHWRARYDEYWGGLGDLPNVRRNTIQQRAHNAYEILSRGLESAATRIVEAVEAPGGISKEEDAQVKVAERLLNKFGISDAKPIEFPYTPAQHAFDRTESVENKKRIIRMIGNDPDGAELAFKLGLVRNREAKSIEDAEVVDPELTPNAAVKNKE